MPQVSPPALRRVGLLYLYDGMSSAFSNRVHYLFTLLFTGTASETTRLWMCVVWTLHLLRGHANLAV